VRASGDAHSGRERSARAGVWPHCFIFKAFSFPGFFRCVRHVSFHYRGRRVVSQDRFASCTSSYPSTQFFPGSNDVFSVPLRLCTLAPLRFSFYRQDAKTRRRREDWAHA